jgi:hypothetical protein
MLIAHDKAFASLRRGGLLMFAALDNRLPVPQDRGTGLLHIRAASE